MWIGGSGSTATGHGCSIRADGKVVKAKAFTKKRRSIAALHGVRGFNPAFDAGLQSPVNAMDDRTLKSGPDEQVPQTL